MDQNNILLKKKIEGANYVINERLSAYSLEESMGINELELIITKFYNDNKDDRILKQLFLLKLKDYKIIRKMVTLLIKKDNPCDTVNKIINLLIIINPKKLITMYFTRDISYIIKNIKHKIDNLCLINCIIFIIKILDEPRHILLNIIFYEDLINNILKINSKTDTINKRYTKFLKSLLLLNYNKINKSVIINILQYKYFYINNNLVNARFNKFISKLFSSNENYLKKAYKLVYNIKDLLELYNTNISYDIYNFYYIIIKNFGVIIGKNYDINIFINHYENNLFNKYINNETDYLKLKILLNIINYHEELKIYFLFNKSFSEFFQSNILNNKVNYNLIKFLNYNIDKFYSDNFMFLVDNYNIINVLKEVFNNRDILLYKDKILVNLLCIILEFKDDLYEIFIDLIVKHELQYIFEIFQSELSYEYYDLYGGYITSIINDLNNN